jgi:hypothetical protein
MWHPIKKAFAGLVVLAAHLLIAVAMVGCIFVTELAFNWAFGERQPLLWGLFPFKYLFQAPEACTMVVYTVWGIIETHRVMKG